MIVKFINQVDPRAVRRLMLAYLRETHDQGGDFPPTLENAAAFVQHALEGVEAGDPCLAIEADGKVVGFHVARGVHFPGMTTRHKTIRSWGTYVLPEYRSRGYAVTLLIVSGRMAKVRGYTRFLGMTHGTAYEKHALGVVDRLPGMKIVGSVMEMDLARKKVHDVAPTEAAAETGADAAFDAGGAITIVPPTGADDVPAALVKQ